MNKIDCYSLLGFFFILLQAESQGTGVCSSGDIRLAGGISYLEGRVEVCRNGIWGTVCDDSWDTAEAGVVCRQLGFSDSEALALTAHTLSFDGGTGQIILDDLNCDGSEVNLFECPVPNDCAHVEDAGVRCKNKDIALVHNGQLLPNNSILSLDSLGNINEPSTNPLMCVSTLSSCCSTDRAGNWYPPVENTPLSISPSSEQLYQVFTNDMTIVLNRLSGENNIMRGLYRCEVPDSNNEIQNLYVGIYNLASREGVVEISSLTYKKSSQTLVCTSTGGPATFVSWKRYDIPLNIDGTAYQKSQIITDTSSATYENRLTIVTQSSLFSGMYMCTVTNTAGQATTSIEVIICRNGETRLTRRIEDQVSVIQICVDNTWLDINSNLVIRQKLPSPRELMVQADQMGFLLSWESPSTGDILSYSAICAQLGTVGGETVSITLDNVTFSSYVPVPTLSSSFYRCCIEAHMRDVSGLVLTSESCQTFEPDSSLSTYPITPLLSPTQNRRIVYILGGIVGVLFLTLIITIIAIIKLIYAARLREYGSETTDTEATEESSNRVDEKGGYDGIQSSSRLYDTIDQAASAVGQKSKSKKTPTGNKETKNSTKKNIANPMYTSIDDFKSRSVAGHLSSSTSSYLRNASLFHSSSSSMVNNAAAHASNLVPEYSTILPRHLREKAPADDSSTSDSIENDVELYSKLQY